MRKVLAMVIVLLFSSLACDAFFPECDGYYTKDSDNMTVAQHVLSINEAIRDKSTLGLLFGLSGYNDPTRSETTQFYQVRYKNTVYDRWLFSVQGGSLQYLSKTMPLFSGNAVYTSPSGFRLETSADKNIVETFVCFDNDVSVATLFACADIPVSQKLTAIAGADSRSFSDGNERAGLVAKVILLLPIEGLSLQAWHRQFRDTKNDSIGYFNPETINFQRLLISYRRGLMKGVRLSIKTGPGLQQVNNDSKTNTIYFESGLEKKIRTGLSFTVNYIYTDSFIDNSLLSYKINIINCNIVYSF